MDKILNLINGELVSPINNDFLDNINPSTGKTYSLVPNSCEEDVSNAVRAAKKAFPAWKNLGAKKRSEFLEKLGDLVLKNLAELALAESLDNGKTLSLAKNVDIPRSAKNFHFFSKEILQFEEETFSGRGSYNTTSHTPLGAVACISPWNLPLYLFTWKIAPALAAGNTVVAKPSEVTPMTAYLLSKLIIEAGFPNGVINIVHGKGQIAGEALISHPDIKAISFTGSSQVGKHIAKVAASGMKKVALEMGGKNPSIVFADCDFEKTLSEVVRAAFANQGQICLCGSRVLIEKSIYEKFKERFVAEVKKYQVGCPLKESSNMGAIVSKEQFQKVMAAINLAKKEGGRILCGGEEVKLAGENASGYFIAPTVIEGLSQKCRTNKEEIFGPVVTLQPFNTSEQAVTLANETAYGLAANLWSKDLDKLSQVSKQLDFGIIWINTWMNRDLRTPFGGMKDSGYGHREGGRYILEFFSEVKNICIGE